MLLETEKINATKLWCPRLLRSLYSTYTCRSSQCTLAFIYGHEYLRTIFLHFWTPPSPLSHQTFRSVQYIFHNFEIAFKVTELHIK